MKNALKCDNCQAQVTPKMTNCTRVHLTTLAFVLSDWSLNSASRSWIQLISTILSFHAGPRLQHCNPSSKGKRDETHSLEYLFPSHILQPRIQIPHFLRNLAQLLFIAALDCRRLPNRQIQAQLDIAMCRSPTQPPSCIVAGGRETNTVVTGISGRESEFARGRAAGVDNSMVVVKGFVDGHGNGEGRVIFIEGGLSGVLKSCVMT